MAEPKDKPVRQVITYRYVFRFADNQEQAVSVVLDAKTLELIEPRRPGGPAPEAMGFCQNSRCPLRDTARPTCPAASGLEDLVRGFAGRQSKELVDVLVETDRRNYLKRTSLQQAVTSLVGLLMATSGCPILGKLKPMVRFHLPFASLEETQYRVLSMYLLAQYLLARRGKTPDWKLRQLVQMYQDIQAVNDHFVKRFSHLASGQPGLNALVILQAFSYAVAFSIDHHLLEEIERLFDAYLDSRA